jgi:hypothetical protein
MPLEEAKIKELTQEHQPSLIASSQRIVNSTSSKHNDKLPHLRARRVSSQDVHNKTITRQFARGFAMVAMEVATEVHPPQEDVEEGIAPEALEVPREEVELTASTSRRGRGRGRGHIAKGRSGLGRS